MLKFKHEFKCRNSQFSIPSLNFRFKFKLPKPRKVRLFIEKDSLGKIETS